MSKSWELTEWLEQHARSIMIVLVAALLCFGAYTWWQARLEQQRIELSSWINEQQSLLKKLDQSTLKQALIKARETKYSSLWMPFVATVQVQQSQSSAVVMTKEQVELWSTLLRELFDQSDKKHFSRWYFALALAAHLENNSQWELAKELWLQMADHPYALVDRVYFELYRLGTTYQQTALASQYFDLLKKEFPQSSYFKKAELLQLHQQLAGTAP